LMASNRSPLLPQYSLAVDLWANESYVSINDPEFTKLPSNKRRRAKTHAP
jgi:hypothetical protein